MGDQPQVVVNTDASADLSRAVACKFAVNGWAIGLIARGKRESRRCARARAGKSAMVKARDRSAPQEEQRK